MVNATIDNTPVSIQLGAGESTTVPSNETWKVTLSVFGRTSTDGSQHRIDVNGQRVFGLGGDMNGGPTNSPTGSFVFKGGDTLEFIPQQNVPGGAMIQGFVVNS